jgi:hypothetical protein
MIKKFRFKLLSNLLVDEFRERERRRERKFYDFVINYEGFLFYFIYVLIFGLFF